MKQSIMQKIDGKDYTFTQMDSRLSVRTILKITNIGGTGLGNILGALDFEKLDLNQAINELVDFDKLGEGISKFGDKLDDERTIEIMENLLTSVLHNSQSMTFDHVNFHGELLHLLKVVKVSFEVNYKDFFGAAQGIVSKLQNLAVMTLGQQMSNGTSGDQSSTKSPPLKKSKDTGQ
jgi:hypothetical protein